MTLLSYKIVFYVRRARLVPLQYYEREKAVKSGLHTLLLYVDNTWAVYLLGPEETRNALRGISENLL